MTDPARDYHRNPVIGLRLPAPLVARVRAVVGARGLSGYVRRLIEADLDEKQPETEETK